MVRKIDKKLSEKTYDITIAELKKYGKLKLFWFQVQIKCLGKTKVFCLAINCTNNSKSKVSTFKFTQDSKIDWTGMRMASNKV